MKSRFWILMLLILGSLAVMLFLTSKPGKNAVVLADASTVVGSPSKYMEQDLRVRGFVKPGTVLRYGERADFIMTLDGKDLKVHFDGTTQLPDTFADNAPVRADGKLSDKDPHLLVSHKIEAKCASKYEADYAKRRVNGNTSANPAEKEHGYQ